MVGGHHFLFSSSSAAWDSGSRANLCVCRWPSGQAKVIFGTFQCRVITSLPLYHDSMLLVRDKRKLRACFLFLKRGPHFYLQSPKIKIQSLFTLMSFQTSMILYSGTQKEKFTRIVLNLQDNVVDGSASSKKDKNTVNIVLVTIEAIHVIALW